MAWLVGWCPLQNEPGKRWRMFLGVGAVHEIYSSESVWRSRDPGSGLSRAAELPPLVSEQQWWQRINRST